MWLRIIVGNHALPANQQNREPSLALCNFDDWPKFGLNISDINGSCLRSTLESTPAHAAQRIVQQPSMRCSEASQRAQLTRRSLPVLSKADVLKVIRRCTHMTPSGGQQMGGCANS